MLKFDLPNRSKGVKIRITFIASFLNRCSELGGWVLECLYASVSLDIYLNLYF